MGNTLINIPVVLLFSCLCAPLDAAMWGRFSCPTVSVFTIIPVCGRKKNVGPIWPTWRGLWGGTNETIFRIFRFVFEFCDFNKVERKIRNNKEEILFYLLVMEENLIGI